MEQPDKDRQSTILDFIFATALVVLAIYGLWSI
jgi:hypothetical protein